MDSDEQPAFPFHKADRTGVTTFTEHPSRLYLHDLSIQTATPDDDAIMNAYLCLNTVSNNKSKYTKHQVQAADDARKLYHMLGRPSIERFFETLANNYLLNCPVTVDDAKRAEAIYGKDVAFLKGKTTAKPAEDHVKDYLPIPPCKEILSIHLNVTLCADLFYVLGMIFSLTTS